MKLAICIGCGCDDNQACPTGCCWLAIDRQVGLGVCSECGGELMRWAAGDRALSPEAAAAERAT